MNLEFPYLYFKIWIECSYLHDSFVHYFLDSEYRWKRSLQMLPSLLTLRLWMFRSSHQPRAFLRRGEGGRPPSPRRRKALGTRLWIAKNREWKLNNLPSFIHYSLGASLFFLSSSCLFIIHNDSPPSKCRSCTYQLSSQKGRVDSKEPSGICTTFTIALSGPLLGLDNFCKNIGLLVI